jgi:hypothetical protein
VLCLLDGLGGDLAGLADLTGDFVDRGRHLLAGRGDRLDAGGGFLGGGGHHAGQLLRAFGGAGQGAGGRLQLGGGGGDGIDDIADGGLELVGELLHVGLALGSGARLGFLLRGLHFLDAGQIILEGLGGAGIVADLVVARRIRDLDRLVAVGELHQHFPDPADRAGD